MNFKLRPVDGEMMRTCLVLAAMVGLVLATGSPAQAEPPVLPAPPPAIPAGPPNGVVESSSTGSGTPDYRVYFDSRGRVAREELDYLHRGRMDTFYYYKNGVLDRVEIDSRGNGKIDIWVYLLDGTYVERYERDTTGSGKPDVVKVFGK
jgi:hypothetical protein